MTRILVAIGDFETKKVGQNATKMLPKLHNAGPAFPPSAIRDLPELQCEEMRCDATTIHHDNVILVTSLQ